MRLGTMLVLAAMIGTAAADEVPLDLTVSQHEAHEIERSGNTMASASAPAPNSSTVSETLNRAIAFTVTLHNKGMDDLSGVGVKLYVMKGPNSLDANAVRQQLRVAKVLSRDGLAIPSGQDATAELGEVDLTAQESTSVQAMAPIPVSSGGTGQSSGTYLQTTRSGDLLRGYVAEIYLDGKLAGVRIGNGAMKKAYEEYLAHPDGAPSKPSPRPAHTPWPPPAQLPP